MDLQKVIRLLEAAEGPDERIEALLGMLLGYKLADGTHAGEDVSKRVWVTPEGDKARMPRFTKSFDAAWSFASRYCGEPNVLALTFGRDGRGSAQVNESQAKQFATPAIALCAAALKAKMTQQS